MVLRLKAEDVAIGLLVAWLVWRHLDGTRESQSTPAGGVEPVRTGRQGIPDAETWGQTRVSQTLDVIRQGFPQLSADKAKQIAISLVAQWAVETGRGKSEWNYNLGGWRWSKRYNRPWALIRNGTTGAMERWDTWPDVFSSIREHGQRLHERFPKALEALVADPESDDWIRELAKGGYFGRDELAGYLAGWRDNREWLAPLAAFLQPAA